MHGLHGYAAAVPASLRASDLSLYASSSALHHQHQLLHQLQHQLHRLQRQHDQQLSPGSASPSLQKARAACRAAAPPSMSSPSSPSPRPLGGSAPASPPTPTTTILAAGVLAPVMHSSQVSLVSRGAATHCQCACHHCGDHGKRPHQVSLQVKLA